MSKANRHGGSWKKWGIKFRSKFELELAEWFDVRRISFEYEPYQYSYTLPATAAYMCEGCKGPVISQHTYTPDFYFPDYDFYIEAKGLWSTGNRRLAEAMQTQNPDVDIRLVFMRDNTLSKSSQTRYSAYAEKKGLLYSIKLPNEEWFND